MRVLAVLAAFAAGLMCVAGGAAAAKPAVITNIRYSPKPLYNDEIGLTISFTAARKAKPGYEWTVAVSISSKAPLLSCSNLLVSDDPNFGGNRRRHMRRAGTFSVRLFGKVQAGIPNSQYLCRGKASVLISEEKIGSNDGKYVGAAEFRVAEAP